MTFRQVGAVYLIVGVLFLIVIGGVFISVVWIITHILMALYTLTRLIIGV